MKLLSAQPGFWLRNNSRYLGLDVNNQKTYVFLLEEMDMFPCLKVHWQCSEGVLETYPSTRTPGHHQ